MGIPYYFSYIIKKYPKIIQPFLDVGKNKSNFIVHNFYLDSNSIIYDVVNNIIKSKKLEINVDINTYITNEVIKQLETYINIVQPMNNIYIAFDSIVPLAKMEQQKTRRYKSAYLEYIKSTISKNSIDIPLFDTLNISSGTDFMIKLTTDIKHHFNYNSSIFVSNMDDYGEGEHKIFNFIRCNPEKHLNKNTLIYGLDADLIMLSLNHTLQSNIYLLREKPFFQNEKNEKNIKNNDVNNEKELYLLDIQLLCNSIQLTINIYDYIFICFLLGNDFLPHFPAINIRTNGINKLMYAYTVLFKSKNKTLLVNGKICFDNLYKFFKFLSNKEHEFINDEFKERNAYESIVLKKNMNNNNISSQSFIEKKMEQFNKIPMFERDLEKYIAPNTDYWEDRYYQVCFNLNPLLETFQKSKYEIYDNYLKMLEWTFYYYKQNCSNWRISYKYHYPPLIQDLVKYIPIYKNQYKTDTLYIPPYSPDIQLLYILPKNKYPYILPKHILNKIHLFESLKNQNDTFDNIEIIWCFKKYFYESSPLLCEINLNQLEEEYKEIIYNIL